MANEETKKGIMDILRDSKKPNKAITPFKPYEENAASKQAKENIVTALEQCKDVLEQAAEIAKDAPHPRCFEVYATLLNTYLNGNKLLIQDRKNEHEEQPQQNNTYVAEDHSKTIILHGTAKDLMDKLKNNDEDI